MKLPRTSRRKFLFGALLAGSAALLSDALLIEPTWLMVRRLRMGNATARHRFVHFSDLHHKGNIDYLQAVVQTINSLTPDCVFFTGDLLEEAKFLPETLAILSGISAPMFGVPGNRDFLSGISFQPVKDCFAATGGAWLMDETREILDGQINLIGITCRRSIGNWLPLRSEQRNLLLMHFPAWVKSLGTRKFDLILAGHSHGGQVRVPFYGPLIIPPGVDQYDLGLFHTGSGPLYVSAGIGYLEKYNIRFNCRPEITVIEM